MKHMERWWEDGRIVARFEAKFERTGPDGCWLWTAYRTRDGYGILQVGNRPVLAHRLALSRALDRTLTREELALHSCDRPACVNPKHLRTGTDADNVKDRDDRARRRAPKGTLNGRAELTEQDVREIRAILTQPSRPTFTEIARTFGVSKPTISHINARRTWRHVA